MKKHTIFRKQKIIAVHFNLNVCVSFYFTTTERNVGSYVMENSNQKIESAREREKGREQRTLNL